MIMRHSIRLLVISLAFPGALFLSGCSSSGGGYRSTTLYSDYGYPYYGSGRYYYDDDYYKKKKKKNKDNDDNDNDNGNIPDRPDRPDRPMRPTRPGNQPVTRPSGGGVSRINQMRKGLTLAVGRTGSQMAR